MRSIGFWGVFQLVCLALFLGITAGRTLSLLIRYRVNPIKLRVNKRGAQGLLELSLFVNVNLWAAAVVVQAVAPRLLAGSWLFGALFSVSSVSRCVGLGFVVLAFLILVLAQIALGRAWRLGIDEENPGELVTDGIYALCRNPIYLFFDMYFVGTFLLNSARFFAFSAVFTVLNLHYQILSEEQHLAKLFGSDYYAYCARTARYWPGLHVLRFNREAQKVDTG